MENGTPENNTATNTELESLKAQLEMAEKRRRDTQSAYTKGQQEISALKAQIEALREEVSSSAIALPQEVEELKYSDVDAYYQKRRELEIQAQTSMQARIDEASKKAYAEQELANRKAFLADFRSKHADFELTDEFLELDVPPRFKKELEKTGDFEKFIQDCYEWGKSGKVYGSATKAPPKQPDLSKLGGDNNPSESAQAKDIVQSYKNTYGF